jgi:hypothetical protein
LARKPANEYPSDRRRRPFLDSTIPQHDKIQHASKPRKSFSTALSAAITPQNHPLDSLKTQEKLAAWMKESGKRFKDAKQLNPMGVALRTDIGRSYIFYEQLSSDAAHPSLDALNRHVVPHTKEEVGGIDVDPVPRDAEIVETLEYLCMAVIGVLVGVNQIIGGTEGGNALNWLADLLSDAAVADHTTVRAHARASS